MLVDGVPLLHRSVSAYTQLPSSCTYLAYFPADRDGHDDELTVAPGPQDAPEFVALRCELHDVFDDADRLRGIGVRLPLGHGHERSSSG